MGCDFDADEKAEHDRSLPPETLQILHVIPEVQGDIDAGDGRTYTTYAFVDHRRRIWEQRSEAKNGKWTRWWEVVATIPRTEEEARRKVES